MQSNPRILANLLVILVKILMLVNLPVIYYRFTRLGGGHGATLLNPFGVPSGPWAPGDDDLQIAESLGAIGGPGGHGL